MMSIHEPIRSLQGMSSGLHGDHRDDAGQGLGDRHLLLLEAGLNHRCLNGDLLSLMSSVERPDLPRRDAGSWLRRILGV